MPWSKALLLVICSFPFLLNAGDAFVSVKNGQFIKQGRPYYFVGANYWYGPLLGTNDKGLKRMRAELDEMQAYGITNLRVLVGAEGGQLDSMVRPALQPKQGEYNLRLFVGLDRLLVEMKKRNMVAVLYLNNNWIWSGGMAQYLNWNGYGEIPNPFSEQYDWQDYMSYTRQFHQCKPCRMAYLSHLEQVLSRTNSISGVKYTTDPTIMSWQLANEPRIFSADNEHHFAAWINESVAKVQSLAPKQLISTGSEGTAGSADNIQLYERIHSHPDIDYLTMHIWPKNWSWYDPKKEKESTELAIQKATDYIQLHSRTARKLRKPVVLSEFGFPRDGQSLAPQSNVQYRNIFYYAMFSQIEFSASRKDVFAGSNFWGYGGLGKANPSTDGKWLEGSDFLADPPQEPQGLNTVFSSDKSTLTLIKRFNDSLEEKRSH